MRLPADQRRQQLLDVAREVFAANGFHETSMDVVAEAAGVTKPVLYQHFPSKRALYMELLEHTGAQLLEQLDVATKVASSPRERVEAGFFAYFRFVVHNQASFRLLFSTSIRSDPEFSGVVDKVVRAAADVIAELIEIPASGRHRHVLADALVGMAEAVGLRAVDDTEAELDAALLARWVSELAWFGLRGIRAETEAAARGSQLP
jgi:AcrR family transcriptional regulator